MLLTGAKRSELVQVRQQLAQAYVAWSGKWLEGYGTAERRGGDGVARLGAQAPANTRMAVECRPGPRTRRDVTGTPRGRRRAAAAWLRDLARLMRASGSGRRCRRVACAFVMGSRQLGCSGVSARCPAGAPHAMRLWSSSLGACSRSRIRIMPDQLQRPCESSRWRARQLLCGLESPLMTRTPGRNAAS